MAENNKEIKLQLVKVIDENLIKTIAYLQTLAMNGDIHGLAGTVYSQEYRHKIIVCGEYLARPHTARRPVEELELVLKEQSRLKEEFQIVRI